MNERPLGETAESERLEQRLTRLRQPRLLPGITRQPMDRETLIRTATQAPAHAPHDWIRQATTRSPAANRLTSGPTAATTPATS